MLRDAEPRPRAAGPAAAEDIDLRLGLIGDNIAQSKAPLLHETAGHLAGLAVRYDRLVPREQGLDFGALFARCAAEGYRGLNITYPYKEQAARRVAIDDPLVRAMGAVNTVTFEPPICEVRDARGFNTDYSGFIAAYRQVLGARRAGRVWMIGAGGVGKAVAFGLLTLGLEALSIVDLDRAKATDLATRLRAADPQLPITLAQSPGDLSGPVDGVINCTPVGMVGCAGTPLPRDRMRGAGWAFDAIYTPLATQFLQDAAAEALTVISGYELFFHQGVDAWQIFSGRPVEAAQLRRLLTEAGAGPEG
jgi:shikimate dehydrogenase